MELPAGLVWRTPLAGIPMVASSPVILIRSRSCSPSRPADMSLSVALRPSATSTSSSVPACPSRMLCRWKEPRTSAWNFPPPQSESLERSPIFRRLRPSRCRTPCGAAPSHCVGGWRQKTRRPSTVGFLERAPERTTSTPRGSASGHFLKFSGLFGRTGQILLI